MIAFFYFDLIKFLQSEKRIKDYQNENAAMENENLEFKSRLAKLITDTNNQVSELQELMIKKANSSKLKKEIAALRKSIEKNYR
jgi:hypothetical protein